MHIKKVLTFVLKTFIVLILLSCSNSCSSFFKFKSFENYYTKLSLCDQIYTMDTMIYVKSQVDTMKSTKYFSVYKNKIELGSYLFEGRNEIERVILFMNKVLNDSLNTNYEFEDSDPYKFHPVPIMV